MPMVKTGSNSFFLFSRKIMSDGTENTGKKTQSYKGKKVWVADSVGSSVARGLHEMLLIARGVGTWNGVLERHRSTPAILRWALPKSKQLPSKPLGPWFQTWHHILQQQKHCLGNLTHFLQ